MCPTDLGFCMIPVTYYVPDVCTWYQPAEIYTYVRYVPPVDAHVGLGAQGGLDEAYFRLSQ